MSEPLDRLCSELRIKLHGIDRELEKDYGRLHCSRPGADDAEAYAGAAFDVAAAAADEATQAAL